jgi:excisionase family DNA binding protein
MKNPFKVIEMRLCNIENLIFDLKHQSKEEGESAPQPDKLLTVREAAEFLGITVPTVYTKTSKGELPVCKPNGSKRLYFSKQALVDYIKAGRKKTNSEIEAEADEYLLNKKKGLRNGK